MKNEIIAQGNEIMEEEQYQFTDAQKKEFQRLVRQMIGEKVREKSKEKMQANQLKKRRAKNKVQRQSRKINRK